MKCSVEDCPREALKRNLCEAHYCKFRRNGTLKCKPIAEKGKPLKWLLSHASYADEACLVWPFFRDNEGYGRTRLNGVSMYASRAMCIIANGSPPFSEAHAAHVCGNGHEGCVNPRHLYWATSKQNNDDRRKHGTMPVGEKAGQSKLTEDQVLSIHAARVPASVLAKKYGVTEATVYAILGGKTWSWLTGGVADWCAPGYETRSRRHVQGWPADHPR